MSETSLFLSVLFKLLQLGLQKIPEDKVMMLVYTKCLRHSLHVVIVITWQSRSQLFRIRSPFTLL